jgi:hypothetical protein
MPVQVNIRLTRLGQELMVGEVAADDEEGVALLHGVLRRRRAQQPQTAHDIGVVIGDRSLAEQGVDEWSAQPLGHLHDLLAGPIGAAADEHGHLLALVEEVGGLLQQLARRQRTRRREGVAAVVQDVHLGAALGVRRPLLDVLGDGDVRHGAPAQRRADRLVHHVLDVGRPHDALVVQGDVHVDLVEIDVLLEVGADEVVEGVAGDGQHGLAVVLGVVQTVEQVDAARPGGRHTHAQRAGRLGVAAGREGGGLFVTHLHELDLVLVLAQRLEKAIDAITRETEDHLHAPVE